MPTKVLPLPPIEYLKTKLIYDPDTGIFTRIFPSKHAKNKICKLPKNPNKYLSISIDGILYLAHRLAFLMVYGWCPDTLDHKDRNRHNNVISNLRPASLEQNGGNSKGNSISATSQYKGVYFLPKYGMWRALIGDRNSKDSRLGAFYTEEEAAQAYNHAALIKYGEFAHLNNLPEKVLITSRRFSSKALRGSKTGFIGVSLNMRRLKEGSNIPYEAYLKDKVYIGSYRTAMEAALEFDLAAQRANYHPAEFNFPPKYYPLSLLEGKVMRTRREKK